MNNNRQNNTLFNNRFLKKASNELREPMSLNEDEIKGLINRKKVKKIEILQNKWNYETNNKELQDEIMEFEEICLHRLISDCKKRYKNQTNFKANIFFNEKKLTKDYIRNFFDNSTLTTEKKVFVEEYIFKLCKEFLQFKNLIIKMSRNMMETFEKIENIYYYELFEKLSLLIK